MTTALDALTLARSEVAALLAERDQLREEVERARADAVVVECLRRRAAGEDARARADERALIVAWMRGKIARHRGPRTGMRVVGMEVAPSALAWASDLADEIERGAHGEPEPMPPRVAEALAVAERLVPPDLADEIEHDGPAPVPSRVQQLAERLASPEGRASRAAAAAASVARADDERRRLRAAGKAPR